MIIEHQALGMFPGSWPFLGSVDCLEGAVQGVQAAGEGCEGVQVSPAPKLILSSRGG